MGKTEELEKIEKTIKETETRLQALRTNIEALDSEIKKISTLERVLIDNVKVLKTQRVIAIAKEFSKAKMELKKVKTRLSALVNDREHFDKVHKDTNDVLRNAQSQYDKIVRNSQNNIIRFRREDGKK